MKPVVVVTNVGKTFRRYDPHRPVSIQEAVAKGLRGIRSVEKFWGLRDVSFTVEAGRAVGVIGANGSGKSTLLRLIGGVGRPDTGQIVVDGRLGALLDLGAGFHPDLTGRENAILAGILNGLTRREVLHRLDSIVAFAEVESAFDNPIRTFSSGMLMRLAFSVAVHADPDILLIDEVLSVGDIGFQRKCLDRIAQFKEAGCAILLVSHEASIVESFCDKAIWLSAGRLILQGPADEVVGQYAIHMRGSLASSPESASEQTLAAAGSTPIAASATPDSLPAQGQRFGSMELEIEQVRILDGGGRPVEEVASGEPLRIDMTYIAHQNLAGPIFCSRILREDGLFCYDLHSEFEDSLTVNGPGRISLFIDRLDLNTGRYVIEVGCYARDWAYSYDYQYGVGAVVVIGRGKKDAILNVPYRWKIEAGGQADVVSSSPADASSL
jgi:lipopolysaccharide transport system ATP-binding protein